VELLSLETLRELVHSYGYVAVFLGIALENTGVPIPGETLTLAGGFLAGAGELRYGYVLASAIAGAVLGDNLGYWLGRWGGWAVLGRVGRWFGISLTQLEQVREQFADNAARAVLLGRFVTFLRIFAGPLAGIARMPYPQFLLCNLAGAMLWALTMVTLAAGLARVMPLQQIATRVGQFGLLTLVGAIAVVAVSVSRQLKKDECD